MKACPYCAEEILDAAIVCKHCQRDLVASPVAVPAPAKSHKVRDAVIVAVVVIGGLLMTVLWSGFDREDYLAFDQQRKAWHRRCDVYIGTPNNKLDETGRACLQEMDALTAHAKRNGWM